MIIFSLAGRVARPPSDAGRLSFSAYLKYEETFILHRPLNPVIRATSPQTFIATLRAFTYTMPHNHKFSCMATFSVEEEGISFFHACYNSHKVLSAFAALQPQIEQSECVMNKRQREREREELLRIGVYDRF